MYNYYPYPPGAYPYPPQPPRKEKKNKKKGPNLSVAEIEEIATGWNLFLEEKKKDTKKPKFPTFNLLDTMFLLTVFALPLAAIEIASVKIAMQIAKEMLK